jgi:hypothetical protein
VSTNNGGDNPLTKAECKMIIQMRIPTKPARHSNMKPATRTDLKPAMVPI